MSAEIIALQDKQDKLDRRLEELGEAEKAIRDAQARGATDELERLTEKFERDRALLVRDVDRVAKELDTNKREAKEREAKELEAAAHPPAGCSAHERNVADVIRAAMQASPACVSRMADLARGSKQPGKVFGAGIVKLIAHADLCLLLRRKHPEQAEAWMSFLIEAAVPNSGLALLTGLSNQEARSLVSKFLERGDRGTIKPVGVIADMVFAALQRGVDLQQYGSTLGPKHGRSEIVKSLDMAVRRERST